MNCPYTGNAPNPSNMEEWIKEKNGCLFVRLHVQPRASKNEIAGIHGDSLKVRLTSPPVEGAANSLLIEFMAKRLGVSRSKVEIVAGEKSRHKTLKIEGLSKAEAATSLDRLDMQNW